MRISLDSPFDPTDVAAFRRDETTLIVLNLGVLAALAAMHVAFVSLLGPPPRGVLLAIGARFIEQTIVLARLQGRSEPLSARAVRRWAHVSTWVGLAFAILVVSLGTFEDSHYPVLFVLPLLSAAFRFSLPAAFGVTLLASAITIGQVWLHGRARPQMAPSEYFESVTMALVYIVVTPVVAMLVRGLRDREQAVRAQADVLRRTRDKLVAEEKFAAVGRLASAVAHEVRNPVAMIVTSLSRAAKPDAPDALRAELVDIATREAGRLERVTTDFLAYARPRSLQRRRTIVSDALGYVADLLRPDADRRGVTLHVEVADMPPIDVDAFQVHQALLNLGTNAVKATAAGGDVRLTARIEANTIVLAVENPGPRIPDEVATHIFEPFFTTRPDGTGLGLPIAKKIAEAHGGDIVLAMNTDACVRFACIIPAVFPLPDDAGPH